LQVVGWPAGGYEPFAGDPTAPWFIPPAWRAWNLEIDGSFDK